MISVKSLFLMHFIYCIRGTVDEAQSFHPGTKNDNQTLLLLNITKLANVFPSVTLASARLVRYNPGFYAPDRCDTRYLAQSLPANFTHLTGPVEEIDCNGNLINLHMQASPIIEDDLQTIQDNGYWLQGDRKTIIGTDHWMHVFQSLFNHSVFRWLPVNPINHFLKNSFERDTQLSHVHPFHYVTSDEQMSVPSTHFTGTNNLSTTFAESNNIFPKEQTNRIYLFQSSCSNISSAINKLERLTPKPAAAIVEDKDLSMLAKQSCSFLILSALSCSDVIDNIKSDLRNNHTVNLYLDEQQTIKCSEMLTMKRTGLATAAIWLVAFAILKLLFSRVTPNLRREPHTAIICCLQYVALLKSLCNLTFSAMWEMCPWVGCGLFELIFVFFVMSTSFTDSFFVILLVLVSLGYVLVRETLTSTEVRTTLFTVMTMYLFFPSRYADADMPNQLFCVLYILIAILVWSNTSRCIKLLENRLSIARNLRMQELEGDISKQKLFLKLVVASSLTHLISGAVLFSAFGYFFPQTAVINFWITEMVTWLLISIALWPRPAALNPFRSNNAEEIPLIPLYRRVEPPPDVSQRLESDTEYIIIMNPVHDNQQTADGSGFSYRWRDAAIGH